jgi:hypothetical protein
VHSAISPKNELPSFVGGCHQEPLNLSELMLIYDTNSSTKTHL